MGKEKRAAIYLRVSTGEQTVDNTLRNSIADRANCPRKLVYGPLPFVMSTRPSGEAASHLPACG
jgi:hypothetical protein